MVAKDVVDLYILAGISQHLIATESQGYKMWFISPVAIQKQFEI